MDRVRFYNLSFKSRVKRQLKKFKRYCYISLCSSSVLFILLFIFTSILKIYYLFSFIMAFILSTTLNFTLNKIYIFNFFNPKRLTRQYYEFFIIGFSVFFVNVALLYIFVEFFHFYYLLAQLTIGLIGLPILFLIHKKVVFSYPRN